VCVCEREREREREAYLNPVQDGHSSFTLLTNTTSEDRQPVHCKCKQFLSVLYLPYTPLFPRHTHNLH